VGVLAQQPAFSTSSMASSRLTGASGRAELKTPCSGPEVLLGLKPKPPPFVVPAGLPEGRLGFSTPDGGTDQLHSTDDGRRSKARARHRDHRSAGVDGHRRRARKVGGGQAFLPLRVWKRGLRVAWQSHRRPRQEIPSAARAGMRGPGDSFMAIDGEWSTEEKDRSIIRITDGTKVAAAETKECPRNLRASPRTTLAPHAFSELDERMGRGLPRKRFRRDFRRQLICRVNDARMGKLKRPALSRISVERTGEGGGHACGHHLS